MIAKTISGAFALALGALALCPEAALAQAWPNKTIRLIVPFPAGGGVDYIGRLVGKGLSDRLGQQVVIDNRPGANAILGLEALKASAPDGYTIAAASAGPLAVNPFIYAKLPHDTLKDFTQIANMVNFPLLLVVHPSLPVKSVKELIALAKARPGEITYASPGSGPPPPPGRYCTSLTREWRLPFCPCCPVKPNSSTAASRRYSLMCAPARSGRWESAMPSACHRCPSFRR